MLLIAWTSASSAVPYAWRAQTPRSYAIRSEKRGRAYRISPRLHSRVRNWCEHSHIIEIIGHFEASVKGRLSLHAKSNSERERCLKKGRLYIRERCEVVHSKEYPTSLDKLVEKSRPIAMRGHYLAIMHSGLLLAKESARSTGFTPGIKLDKLSHSSDENATVTGDGSMPQDELSTPNETATYLKVPVATVWRSCRQAMAAGTPVIATNSFAVRDVVEHGRTGWLVPPNDARALAERLVQCANDSLMIKRMGASARETAATYYDWETIATRYEDLFFRLAAGSKDMPNPDDRGAVR